MALTRGDKLIIIGAVALAGAVVLGLAVLKRPELFTGTPKTRPVAMEATARPVPIPPAPTAVPAATPIAPAPSSAPAPTGRPTPAPAPSVVPTPEAPGPAASGKAAKPDLAGEESLDKMFAEIARDSRGPDTPAPKAQDAATAEPKPAPAPGTDEPKPAPAPGGAQAADTTAPSQPAPAPTQAEPKAAPAKSSAKAMKADHPAKTAKAGKTAKPAAQAAPKTKPKPQTKTKTKTASAPRAATGRIIRLVAEDRLTEFVVTVQTDKAPPAFTKMFLADPPRMVLDLPGAWAYAGPGARNTGTGLIRRIRVGTHPDLFRVVLDMAPDALSRLRGTPTAERVPGGVTLKIPK